MAGVQHRTLAFRCKSRQILGVNQCLAIDSSCNVSQNVGQLPIFDMAYIRKLKHYITQHQLHGLILELCVLNTDLKYMDGPKINASILFKNETHTEA
jgi:hypothetical protein